MERRRMEPKRDTQAATPGEKSRRTPSFTERRCNKQENPSERHHPGNTSEAAQMSTQSSSDRDIEQDADPVFLHGRPNRREQNWRKNRGEGSKVTSQPSDNPGRWLQSRGSEVQSRPHERKSNTSKLGQLKGGEGEPDKKEETTKEETTEQVVVKEETTKTFGVR